MSKEKCYYLKRNKPYASYNEPTIELYGKNLILELNEDWERCPSIEVNIGEELSMETPQSSEYLKVKRIIPELFDSYYNDTIKFLGRNFLEKGEYFMESFSYMFRVYGYTDKQCLSIDIGNEITNFCCSISLCNGIRGRNTARKKFEILPEEVVKQVLELTLEFLYNRQSLSNFKDEYWKQISFLLKEQKPIKGLILNADLAFNEVRSQMLSRIEEVENRLINYDDSADRRLELRGELKGLKYGMKVLDGGR